MDSECKRPEENYFFWQNVVQQSPAPPNPILRVEVVLEDREENSRAKLNSISIPYCQDSGRPSKCFQFCWGGAQCKTAFRVRKSLLAPWHLPLFPVLNKSLLEERIYTVMIPAYKLSLPSIMENANSYMRVRVDENELQESEFGKADIESRYPTLIASRCFTFLHCELCGSGRVECHRRTLKQ